MKQTTTEAISAFTVISELPKLPMKAAYRLSLVAAHVTSPIRVYETRRQELLKELGTPDQENSGRYTLSAENRAKFEEQLLIMLNEEIDVPFEPLKLEDFGDVELTPAQVGALGKLITG